MREKERLASVQSFKHTAVREHHQMLERKRLIEQRLEMIEQLNTERVGDSLRLFSLSLSLSLTYERFFSGETGESACRGAAPEGNRERKAAIKSGRDRERKNETQARTRGDKSSSHNEEDRRN